MPTEDALQDDLAALPPRLTQALDELEALTRRMHPPLLADLVARTPMDADGLSAALDRVHLGSWPDALISFRDQIVIAGNAILRAWSGFRAAAATGDLAGAYRASREQYRAIEALYPLAGSLPIISRFFQEPDRRDDPAPLEASRHPNPDTGIFHHDNETSMRGGFSVYVPEYLTPDTPAPIVVALHGGAGHGRVFLWNWLREARSRGIILVAPTATGDTWSLREPEIDIAHLSRVLDTVRARWSIDPTKMLLSGMSDGGTFTLLSGLNADSPFTHLAPVAASFHPMLLTMSEPQRIRGLPIYLVHGALDWMFPIRVGRTANETLRMAGADVAFREIANLSHTYPRDENGAILSWLTRDRQSIIRSG